mmetsp:Transcript_58537/g.173950  ORF Transcript_58537/g.173950 Transcript_58537/m.173950 type:complete len:188 (-) Transcript_58537:196-759(-)
MPLHVMAAQRVCACEEDCGGGRGRNAGSERLLRQSRHPRSPRCVRSPKQSSWAVDVHDLGEASDGGRAQGDGPGATWHVATELRPRVSPNPRLLYQTATFYAGAHPPLAASMVWLAGRQPREVVYDPFCGTGMELVESGHRRLSRTVRDTQAYPRRRPPAAAGVPMRLLPLVCPCAAPTPALHARRG